ncbi:MAG: hypothetical protein NC218_07225 [Acetobacter sp.]|nr:hypothetical protein [Acetobacter sp.]
MNANWIVEHYPIDDEDVLIAAQFCETTGLHHEELRQALIEYLKMKRGYGF